ncbi:MAG: FadR family transcriptional regulator, partial [Mesorhizobium sp.]
MRDNGADSRAGGSSAVDAAAGRILDLIRARQLNVGDVL